MNQPPSRNVAAELAALDSRINSLLPPRYQHCYGSVSTSSMGSADLKYEKDGSVSWGEIWTTFCDLALAGGPPHRGKLLEPVSESAVAAAPGRYRDVVAEIRRAVSMTTPLTTVDGYAPGWVGIRCSSWDEAAWLQFAVTAENVSARRRQAVLQVPAGPDFRVEKEIKNVVVALAKAHHYWDGHLTAAQQSFAGEDVWEPATPDEAAAAEPAYNAAAREIEDGLRTSGLRTSRRRYAGWAGVETADEEVAAWLLRAVLVEQVLARREDRVLYLPIGATADGRSAHVARVFQQAWELWNASASQRQSWQSGWR